MWSLEYLGILALCRTRSAARLRSAPVIAALLLAGLQPAQAAVITIAAGATPPAGSNADNTSGFGQGTPLPATSFQNQVFKSSGWPNGGVFTNRTGSVINDIEITLTSGDTFAAGISGGTAFPTVTYNASKTMVTFSGGNIPTVPAGQAVALANQFWLQIPLSADFTGGVGKYTGNVTPPPPPPKPAVKTSVAPAAGNSPSPTPQLGGAPPPAAISYDAVSHTFQFSPGAINFVEYQNGQVVTSNSVSESIIGSQISIDPTSLIGLSPDVPGAFQLGDSYLSVAKDLQNPTENTFLSGALLQELLIPEAAGGAFDSRLQATISPQESGLGLGSQFISEFFGPASDGWQLDFETNLLAATDNLTISGTSTGVLRINTVVPEPPGVLLFAAGLLGLAAIRRRTSGY